LVGEVTVFVTASTQLTCYTKKHRWEDNIRMDLRQTGWEGVGQMHTAQIRDQWQTVEHSNEVLGSKRGGKFLD